MKKMLVKWGKILMFLAIPFFVFFTIRNFKVAKIICVSQYGECIPGVREKLESFGECSYSACKRSIKAILASEPNINRYSYQLKNPTTIEVLVEERRPVFSLKGTNQKWSALVDENGLVLEITESSELPSLTIDGPLPNPGQNVSVEILSGLELVMGVGKLHDIEVSKIENLYLRVYLKNGYKIIFPLGGDRDFLLGATVLILNELNKDEMSSKIEVGQLKTIDLRFKNPVLKP